MCCFVGCCQSQVLFYVTFSADAIFGMMSLRWLRFGGLAHRRALRRQALSRSSAFTLLSFSPSSSGLVFVWGWIVRCFTRVRRCVGYVMVRSGRGLAPSFFSFVYLSFEGNLFMLRSSLVTVFAASH
jgi:hypothetical protein